MEYGAIKLWISLKLLIYILTSRGYLNIQNNHSATSGYEHNANYGTGYYQPQRHVYTVQGQTYSPQGQGERSNFSGHHSTNSGGHLVQKYNDQQMNNVVNDCIDRWVKVVNCFISGFTYIIIFYILLLFILGYQKTANIFLMK